MLQARRRQSRCAEDRRSHDEPAPPGALRSASSRLTWRCAQRPASGRDDVSLLHLPLGWDGKLWPFRHPLDFIGSDGGGGIGGGPGHLGRRRARAAGQRAPARRDLGDGDFLMGVHALWTAVHYRIPLLFVVANNRSFFNDEVHQERVARMRGRPVENKWIGQRITDPQLDLAALARAQGAQGFGPVAHGEDLIGVLKAAISEVDAGGVAVVDVLIEPGYTHAD